MLATAFWMAEMHSLTELYVANLLQGLAGATNESIVQITVRVPLWLVVHTNLADCGPLLRPPQRTGKRVLYDHGYDWSRLQVSLH